MLGIKCRVAGAVAALLATSCAAGAADLSVPKAFPKEVAAPASPWEFTFTPYAWLIFVTGDVKIGDNTTKVGTNIFEILGEVKNIYAWMSYQELRNGPFSLYANVVWTKMEFSDTRSGVFPIGPLNQSSLNIVANAKVWLNLAIIEPGVTFEVAKWTSGPSTGGAFVPTSAVDLVGGARYWDIKPELDLNVTATVNIPALGLSRTGGGSVSAEKTIDWWDPFVGLRLRHKAGTGQEFSMQGDVGGFGVGSDFTWHVLAAYNVATEFAGLKFTSYLGYRALSIDYEQGSGNRTLGLNFVTHGPVAGLTFRW